MTEPTLPRPPAQLSHNLNVPVKYRADVERALEDAFVLGHSVGWEDAMNMRLGKVTVKHVERDPETREITTIREESFA